MNERMALETATIICQQIADDYGGTPDATALRTVLARLKDLEVMLGEIEQFRDALGKIVGPRL